MMYPTVIVLIILLLCLLAAQHLQARAWQKEWSEICRRTDRTDVAEHSRAQTAHADAQTSLSSEPPAEVSGSQAKTSVPEQETTEYILPVRTDVADLAEKTHAAVFTESIPPAPAVKASTPEAFPQNSETAVDGFPPENNIGIDDNSGSAQPESQTDTFTLSTEPTEDDVLGNLSDSNNWDNIQDTLPDSNWDNIQNNPSSPSDETAWSAAGGNLLIDTDYTDAASQTPPQTVETPLPNEIIEADDPALARARRRSLSDYADPLLQPDVIITADVPNETITLTDPALNRVRNRVLANLEEILRDRPDIVETSRYGSSDEPKAIEMEEIQTSLHKRREAIYPSASEQQSLPGLDVIPEDEVWANLSGTPASAARKSNRRYADGSGSSASAFDISAVAMPSPPEPVRVQASLLPEPMLSDPVHFSRSPHAERFAADFFTTPAHRRAVTTPVETFRQPSSRIAKDEEGNEYDILSEEDFEEYYREQETALRHAAAKETEETTENFFVSENDSGSGYSAFSSDNTIPPLSLLLPPQYNPAAVQSEEELINNSATIEEKLAEYKVKVKVLDAYAGPVITRYEIEPDVGVRGNSVLNLEKDIARSLGVAAIRLVETIPGKTCMGLELPNPKRQIIRLSEIFNDNAFSGSESKLTLALGQDISGQAVVTDLAKAPHLLVAGTTGSGKSVGVNAMILSMLYKASPEDVRMIMIDPKMLELSVYQGIPHLLAPVVTDMKLAANALNWCVGEMEKRYRLMSHVGVRNLAGYNQKIRDAARNGKKINNPFSLNPSEPEPLEKLPYIVVIVDEFADLMMVAGKQIEQLIARLAQKARAAGIHLILATQRPSVDVITGLIKANIPTRIAFQVSSKIDSRTILDQMGAENLLGQGDMLFLPPGTSYAQRVHGAFVADSEVHAVVEYLKQFEAPDYIEDILSNPEEDEPESDNPGSGNENLFDEAVALVLRTQRTSISFLQRKLRVGYNKAADLVEQMENEGILSAADSSGKRTILARRGHTE